MSKWRDGATGKTGDIACKVRNVNVDASVDMTKKQLDISLELKPRFGNSLA